MPKSNENNWPGTSSPYSSTTSTANSSSPPTTTSEITSSSAASDAPVPSSTPTPPGSSDAPGSSNAPWSSPAPDTSGSSSTALAYPTTSPTTVSLTTTLPQSSAEPSASLSSLSSLSLSPSSSTAAAAAASITSGNTTSSLTTSSTSNINTGAIAGGVIGGVIVLILLILGLILYRRARFRKHVAPSSEFAETIKRGELPVLRLDCGVEIVPSAPRHHVPLPLRQDSYYTSPAMSDMKLPDGIGGSDEQSVRHSLEKPLQPLRYPGYQGSNESMMMGNATRRVSSIGSSQEFWSRDAGKFDIRKDYRSISPLPTNTNYTPLMQNTYPMEPSRAVDTLQDSYVDLWKLSVAPMTRPQPDSVRDGADPQPLPPLRPVRRSVDVGSGRKV